MISIVFDDQTVESTNLRMNVVIFEYHEIFQTFQTMHGKGRYVGILFVWFGLRLQGWIGNNNMITCDVSFVHLCRRSLTFSWFDVIGTLVYRSFQLRYGFEWNIFGSHCAIIRPCIDLSY